MSARPALRPALRRTVRSVAVLSAAAGLVALAAGPASAHVTATPSTTTAGAYGLVSIAFAHGCDGSATTRIQVQIPEPVLAVSPTLNDRWRIEKKTTKLSTPIDQEGTRVTTRVSEVVFTAKEPIPDGFRDSLDLSLQLPDATGTELAFPTVQTCERGQAAWIQRPAPGQSPDDVEYPAPAFTLTAAEDHGHDAETSSAAVGSSPVGWVGLGLGALGALLGGTALARTRTSRTA